MSAPRQLRVDGDRIVDTGGTPVVLRGVNLGGWMNMENIVTGYPGTETDQRAALARALGRERAAWFSDLIVDAFFGDGDAEFLAGRGLNMVRMAVNYRQLATDSLPPRPLEDGFARLERAIAACGRHGIWAIVTLHATPGFQNQDWHSDNPSHRAFFWDSEVAQEQALALWEEIARRLRGNPWVAGYNVLNEPADPDRVHLRRFYEAATLRIRAVDPDHILFFDGNDYAVDFTDFPEPPANSVYAIHDYPAAGFIAAPPYDGTRAQVEGVVRAKSAAARERGLPVLVGEFGPQYTGDPEVDAGRLRLLEHQLDVFEDQGASWCLWTYKDLGLAGPVFVDPDSPWSRLMRPMSERKALFGVDESVPMGRLGSEAMDPIVAALRAEFPGWEPYPFGAEWLVRRLVCGILFNEALVVEYGRLFEGLDDDELRRLAASFEFGACRVNDQLVARLGAFAR